MNLRSHYCTMMIHLIFLCFSINELAAATISGNRTLSGDQTIVSSGGNFELGFFSPGKSSKHYIGIWYKKIAKRTIVWVANRETPILDKNSAQFMINSEGNLVLLDDSKCIIWSTNLNSTNSNNSAELHDDGNLVLWDGSNSPLWQSFDYPTHTWLPGGRIGYNKRTRTKQLLTSWINEEDPTPGLFSLAFDPNGSQYLTIRWNGSEQYHNFSLVPEMWLNNNYIYNFSYVDNENESYFTYSTPGTSRFVIDVSGHIKLLAWDDEDWSLFWSQPRQQCEVYAYCGPFSTCQNASPFCSCLQGFKEKSESDWNLKDYSGGCVRDMSLQCDTSSRDKFLTVSNVELPPHGERLAAGSLGGCESGCLSNCSCSAYAYDGNECWVWNRDLLNLRRLNEGDGNGRNMYVRLSASSSVFARNKGGTNTIVATIEDVAIVVGTALALMAVVFLYAWIMSVMGESRS